MSGEPVAVVDWTPIESGVQDSMSFVSVAQNERQSLPVATWSRITFNVVLNDLLGEFSNSVFTAIRAGTYTVNASVAIAHFDTARSVVMGLKVNGNFKIQSLTTGNPGSDISISISKTIQLSVGDVLSLDIYHYDDESALTFIEDYLTYMTIVRNF